MIFYILTLFPDVYSGYLESSILGKAIANGQIQVKLINIRDFALDRHRSCDDAPYGGGPGMLLKPEPVAGALESIGLSPVEGAERGPTRIIFLTPSGRLFDQACAQELAREERVVLVCGHYEGFDQRVVDLFGAEEVSVGDYVLFSGEVASMVILDSTVRLVEGVIKEESVREESFKDGLLEYPQYTRPQSFMGHRVPDILLSGHHQQIGRWRRRQRLKKTLRTRPGLLGNARLTEKERLWLEKKRKEADDTNGSTKGD